MSEDAATLVFEGELSVQCSVTKLQWSARTARLYSDGSLRLYSRRDPRRLARQVTVTDGRLEELGGDVRFEVRTRGGGGVLTAEAPDSRARAAWLSELYHLMYAGCGGVAFGKSLASVMAAQVAAGGQAFVPRLVADCAERLRGVAAPPAVGSGSPAALRRHRLAYQRGERIQPGCVEPADAARLLGDYLAELPEPVLPSALLPQLLALCRCRDVAGQRRLLLSARVAPEARNLLRVACEHSRRQANAAGGLDAVSELADSLLLDRGGDGRAAEAAVADCREVLASLVASFDDVFADLPLVPVAAGAAAASSSALASSVAAASAEAATALSKSLAEMLRLNSARCQQVEDTRAAIGAYGRWQHSNGCHPEPPALAASCDDCQPLRDVRGIMHSRLGVMLAEFEALATRNAALASCLANKQFPEFID